MVMESRMEINTLTWIGDTLFYLLLFFGIVIISHGLFKLKYRKIQINDELSEKDNVAFSLVVLGYYIGVLLLFLGVIHGDFHGYLNEVALVVSFAVIGILLLLSSSYINERIVFRNKVKLYKEIFNDENKGVGYVEAANFISSALVIFGAVSGKTINFFSRDDNMFLHVSGILSLLILWGIGQLFIMLFLKIYIRISRYDIVNQLEKDNVAVGIVFSGILISVSILYSNAIYGDIENFALYLENIAYVLIFGILLLPISRIIIDKIILPRTNLFHEIVVQKIPNQGIALIEAFAYIGSAVLISFCM